MATDSIHLPTPLLDKVREAAASEEITPEELVRDAVENRLSRSGWVQTLAFGERHSRARGLIPADVDAEIAAFRTERGR